MGTVVTTARQIELAGNGLTEGNADAVANGRTVLSDMVLGAEDNVRLPVSGVHDGKGVAAGLADERSVWPGPYLLDATKVIGPDKHAGKKSSMHVTTIHPVSSV